jgi:DNA invertase Pin-like site-specific DNA recombinase
MRAALYARVSTVDRGQDPEVQLGDLREYAVPRDFEVVVEFVDFALGKRTAGPSISGCSMPRGGAGSMSC